MCPPRTARGRGRAAIAPASDRQGWSKVTSKLEVTVPKEVADRYGIRPGSESGHEERGAGGGFIGGGGGGEAAGLDGFLKVTYIVEV